MPMFEYGSHWSGWDLTLMWFMMFAFWGFIIWAVYFAVTGLSRRRWNGDHDEPRRTLDQRLAKGEIDEDKYRRVRELLDTNAGTPVGGRGQ